ncbi:MAG: hypothetical protein V7784_07820 [Oceanospirillaceae bacterium]
MQQNVIDILEKYIRGKDQNQSAILEEIYTKNAKVLFDIKVDTIVFPAEIVGSVNIANTLSRDFNKRHDYVKTYYLTDQSKQFCADNIRDQQWLVIMRDKQTGEIKIGTGIYDWYFSERQGGCLAVAEHKITIAVMLSLPSQCIDLLNVLQQNLPYPWVETQQVITTLKEYSYLDDLSLYIASH